MADRKVSINVALKLDSARFSQDIERMASDFKPIQVPIQINQASLPKLKVDVASLNLDNLVRDSAKSLGIQLGEEITQAIKQIKPETGIFDSLANSITAPFKSIATGALEGIGREISAKLGGGIAKGLEKQVSPIVGSFDTLGEGIVTRGIPSLKNVLPERLTKVSQALVEEFFGKNALQDLSKGVRKTLRDTVGEGDLIIAREILDVANQRQRDRNFRVAEKSLAQKLQQDLEQRPQRLEQAERVEQRRQKLSLSEQQARIELKETQAKLTEYENLVNARVIQQIQLARDSGQEVDAVRQRQIQKEVRNSDEFRAQLLTLQKNEAIASSKLSDILLQRQTLANLISQLRNPISPRTQELIAIGSQAPQIQTLQEITQLASEQRAQFQSTVLIGQQEIARRMQPIERLNQLTQTARENRARALSFYRTDSLDADPERRKELLQKARRERAKYFKQIRAAEKGIEKRYPEIKQVVTNINNSINQAQQDLNAALEKGSQIYVEVQRQLAGEFASITVPNQAVIRPTTPQKTTPRFRTKQDTDVAPEAYKKIVQQVFQISGIEFNSDRMPALFANDKLSDTSAFYNRTDNKILVSPANLQKLITGQIDETITNLIAHEFRHALQFDFGKNLQGTGVQFMQHTNEELNKLAPFVLRSVKLGLANPGKNDPNDPNYKSLLQKTELDAYVFADRYTAQILRNVLGQTDPVATSQISQIDTQTVSPEIKKLSEKQKILNKIRAKEQESTFINLQEANKANIEQLTKAQLTAIAKSAGVRGYSNKKVAELREFLLGSISPEDLSFLIPTFSKADPDIKKTGNWFASLTTEEIKSQTKELSGYFRKTTVTAGRTRNTQQLSEVLAEIDRTRKIFATALAQDINKESQQFLRSAIASLGKQRIAAEQRIKNIQFLQKQEAKAQASTTPSSVQARDAVFGFFPGIGNPVEAELNALRRQVQQRQRVITGEAKPDTRNVDRLINQLNQAATGLEEQIAGYVRQINKQVQNRIINADQATTRLYKLVQAAETEQRRRSNRILKNSEQAFQQSQRALIELEKRANQEIQLIEQRQRYEQQQQARSQQARLQRYGVDTPNIATAPQQRPQRELPSLTAIIRGTKASFQDFQAAGARKQAETLSNQISAVLADIDSQLTISRTSKKEAKLLNKQIAQNEKEIQRILALVQQARAGKVDLTPGDLQRLSGRLQQASSQITQDRERLGVLNPQIQAGRDLTPYARDLRQTQSRSQRLAGREQLTAEDIERLNKYNKKARETLKALGSPPPPGNFFEELNLKMPPLLRNTIDLVKGFVGFQILGFVTQSLQQVAVAAFQTSMRFEVLEKTLTFASGNSVDAAKNLAFVRQEVQRLSAPLEVSIRAFTSLTAAARGTSLEGEQARKVFTAVAQASRVYGLNSEQTEGALLAVQQMISKGTVNAEELRGQLGERLPGAFQVAARAMGVTTAELGKMLELGQVSTETFLPKFAAQLTAETKDGVAGASRTAGASLQRLQNNWTDLNRAIGDAISPAAIAIFDNLSASMSYAQKNAKTLRAVFLALVGTITIAMLPAIIAFGKALGVLALNTIPLLGKAMLAVVATNPVLVAAIATLTVGLIAAEDAAKGLANALNGVSQVDIDNAEADVVLDAKYNKAIQQLMSQVPITTELLNELNAGLDGQAARGVNTAKTTQHLKDQLAKLQKQALLTAESQRVLNENVKNSEILFKRNTREAEKQVLTNNLKIAQAREKGLVGEAAYQDNEYAVQRLHDGRMAELYQQRADTIQAQLKESARLQALGRKGLDPKVEQELREELLKVQADVTSKQVELSNREFEQQEKLRKRRIEDFEEATKVQENYRKSGLVNEQQAVEALLRVRSLQAEEELQQIRAKREKMLKTDKEGLEALAVQESEVYARLAEATKARYQEQFNIIESASSRANDFLEAQKERGIRSEVSASQEAIRIATEQANAQLLLVRQGLEDTPATDIARRDELLVQQQKAMAIVAKARKTAYTVAVKDSNELRDAEIAIASATLQDKDAIAIQEYEAKQRAFDRELVLIQERRKELNTNDIDGHRELTKQEGELYRQRIENQKAFLDAQLQVLEINQQKTKDAVTQAIKDREIEIQRLVNQGVLSQEEAQFNLAKLTRENIAQELKLEEEKLQKLLEIAGLQPQAEEERQNKIRASRIKTSELTLELLRNEKQQQEAFFAALSKAYDRASATIENAANRSASLLQRRLQLSEALDRSLTNQNNLLDARKSLYQALNNFVETEASILSATAKTEEEKKAIAEATANTKIRAARIQNDLDRQSLELQIKQSENANRRLQIENAIAQIRNRADVARKEVALRKAQADPNATPEMVDAARLELEASRQEGLGLQEQARLIQEQQSNEQTINQIKRQVQAIEQSNNLRKLQLDAANAIANDSDREKALSRLRDSASTRLFGTTNAGEGIDLLNRYNRGEALTPLQSFFAQQAFDGLNRNLPNILPTNKMVDLFGGHIDKFGSALQKFMDFVDNAITKPNNVTINAPITNNIESGKVRQTASDTAGVFRQQMYDLGLELNRI